MLTSMPTVSKFPKLTSSRGSFGKWEGDWSKFQPHTSFESFSNANVLLWPVNYGRKILVKVFHHGGTPTPSVQKHDQIPSPNQSPPPPKKKNQKPISKMCVYARRKATEGLDLTQKYT